MARLQSKMRGAMYGLSMIVLAALLLLPRPARAEINSPTPLIAKGDTTPKNAPKSPGKPMPLGLDNDGNVMVRLGDATLTLVYGPEGTAKEIKEKLGFTPPLKESAGIGEVGFKVGFAF